MLWYLIEKAVPLESLCVIGWNTRRNIRTRRHCPNVDSLHWNMRSLPFSRDISHKVTQLRNLELKRIDIDPHVFVDLITQISPSLKELFLNQVYLKIRSPQRNSRGLDLWIGNVGPKTDETCWVAEELRAIPELKFDVLRATGIGYDDFIKAPHPDHPTYDLKGPKGHIQSFDQRFVSAVLSGPDAKPHHKQAGAPTQSLDGTATPTPLASTGSTPPLTSRVRATFDAETYQRNFNSTSEYKRSIDGLFVNHNEQALKELQNIITVADRGMNMLSAEMINRARTEGPMVRDGG
jgi:hypothetical protein